MRDLSVIRHAPVTVVQLNGAVRGGDGLNPLEKAIAGVLPNDYLVLELSEVIALDASGAQVIREILATHGSMGQVFVVSPRPQVPGNSS
jgi:anti-anti-sigma regulatory factor